MGDRVLFDSAQRANLAVAKRRVGYVFQTLALFPHLTVAQNVEYGLAHLPRRARAAIVGDFSGISHSDLAQRSPREISGGRASARPWRERW